MDPLRKYNGEYLADGLGEGNEERTNSTLNLAVIDIST